jgi:hypothetical protein
MYEGKFQNTVLISIVLLLCACTVTWVSEYDAQTDQGVSQLHRKTETFLTQLEQQKVPECLSINHTDFYQQSLVDVRTLKVRAMAIPNNNITVQQLGLLAENLSLMQQGHALEDEKNTCLATETITFFRSNFESTFTAILKFELAKKRQTK